MRNLGSINRLVALVGALLVCGMAQADVITYSFAGRFAAPWGWNFPAGVFQAGTEYLGSVTYDTSIAGTQNPSFSYYTDYVGAALELEFTVGADTFSAYGGKVVSGITPAGAALLSFQNFSSYTGSIGGVPVNDAYLVLRDYSGQANPGGAITADLSGFLPSLASANAKLEFGNGVSMAQSIGNVTSLTPVPETDAYVIFMIGIGMLGLVGRRNTQRTGVVANPSSIRGS